MEKNGQRLEVLQALRGIAAVAVVLFHLNGSIFSLPKYFSYELLPIFRAGHLGVNIFFVLSGFLMAKLYLNRPGGPAVASRFLRKRVVRIYPVYWVVLIPVIATYFLLPGSGKGHETDAWYIVTSIMLWPTVIDPILGVAWTLRFELFFYLAFAGLIMWRRTFAVIFVGWGLAALGSAITMLAGYELIWPLAFVISPWILLFLYGIAGAIWVERGVRSPGFVTVAGAAVLALSIYMTLTIGGVLTMQVCGIGSVLFMAGLVELERQGRLSVPGWLTYSGDISYSLYLVHMPVLSFGIKILFALGVARAAPAIVTASLLFAAALVAGILLHELVEYRFAGLRPRKSGLNLGVQAVMSRFRPATAPVADQPVRD